MFLYNKAGDIECPFEVIKDAIEFLVGLGFVKGKIYAVVMNEEPFLGYVWVPDPDFEYSIPCIAYNEEKDETKRFGSLSECGNHFFGKKDINACIKVRKLINNGIRMVKMVFLSQRNQTILLIIIIQVDQRH